MGLKQSTLKKSNELIKTNKENKYKKNQCYKISKNNDFYTEETNGINSFIIGNQYKKLKSQDIIQVELILKNKPPLITKSYIKSSLFINDLYRIFEDNNYNPNHIKIIIQPVIKIEGTIIKILINFETNNIKSDDNKNKQKKRNNSFETSIILKDFGEYICYSFFNHLSGANLRLNSSQIPIEKYKYFEEEDYIKIKQILIKKLTKGQLR